MIQLKALLTPLLATVLQLKEQLSQAAACDGTRITTTAEGQEIAAGTLPIY